MRVALTGATGFIGGHLCRELAEHGYDLNLLIRRGRRAPALPHGACTVVRGDLGDHDALRRLVDGCDVLVHTAGVKFAASDDEYIRTNSLYTKNLLEAVRTHRTDLRRFIFISSAAVAGPAHGKPLTEDEEPHPTSPYAVSKLRAEEIIREAGSGVPYTILRPPPVYGPDDRDLLVYWQFINGHIRPLLGRRNRFDLVYVKNLCSAVHLSIVSERSDSRAYYITDRTSYTWQSFASMIGKALGKRGVEINVPIWLLRTIGVIVNHISHLMQQRTKLDGNKIVEISHPCLLFSSRRAEDEIGYVPPYSSEEAVRETTEWYRRHGWI